MSAHKRHRSGRRKKNVFKQIIDSAKKLINSVFSSEGKGPKEYRPYLGPNAKSSSPDNSETKESFRVPQKRMIKESFISRLRSDLKSRSKRRKRKLKKRQSLRRQKRDFQRKARQEWIRKFFPNYKKSEGAVFTGIKEKETSETQKDPHKNFYFYTINSTALYSTLR